MKTKLLLLIASFPLSLLGANRTITTNQVTSGISVGSEVDYVINSNTPFSGNSAYVNIPSSAMEHSVIIFKALKPSVVINEWLSYIRINGARAVDGTNCQVKMYNKGSIILPYSASGFTPLTCYSGTNYSGTACNTYSTGSNGGYMRTLTDANLLNNIRSFKLKRGYMVTFATGTSGYGYSRCFIADKEDLEFSTLPPVLDGKISSYRLFKWYNYGKSGIANNTDSTTCDALNVQGCYTYNVGGNMLPDVEWIPHKIHKNWPGIEACGSTEYSCTMKTDNEPANSSDDTPATVAEVLGYWENAMRTGMRLCSPSSHDGGYAWQEEFMNAIDERGWRCDILDMHCYWVTSSFSSLSNYYNKYRRPIWVTEWLWGASWNSNGAFGSGVTDSQIINNKSTILNTMNNAAYIERYFYWNGESKAHIYSDNRITALGQTYAATDGGLGYNSSHEFVPVVVIKKPYLLTGSANDDKIVLTWKDKNGDMMDEIRIQYKSHTGSSWTTLATVKPKDKTGSGDQSYSFSGTLPDARNYDWRIADVLDNEETGSDVFSFNIEFVDNASARPSNTSEYYFQFYSKEASTDLVWAVYDNSSNENRVYYKAANSNYANDLYQLWALEYNSNGGYSLRNVGEPNYLICSPNSWNFTTRNNDYTVEAAKTAFDFIYNATDDYWICKNIAHKMYVGLWDNDKNFGEGEVLAGNRTYPTGNDSGDKLGIRLIPRTAVNAQSCYIPSGEYYLYNNESSCFMAAGNGWDTQGIVAETGISFTLGNAINGYTLDSHISNGGTNHYLGNNIYCDSSPFKWTFAEAGIVEGRQTYTISDGTNYLSSPTESGKAISTTTNPNSAYAKWALITKADLLKQMENATETNPVDATFLIPGHNFGRNDTRIDNWAGSPVRGGYAQGDWGNMNGEKYNTTFDIYQEITDAPDGVYEISMQGFYRNGDYDTAANSRQAGNEALNALLYGNDATLPLPSIFSEANKCGTQGVNQSIYGYIPNSQADASYYIRDGLYATGPLRFTVENGLLRIGVKKEIAVDRDWTLFDNFKLKYLGPAYIKGDVNKDGQITIADVTALVNIILGKDNIEPYQYDHQAADVNEDNSTTIADVTALVNIILGKN
ncbi:MAG: hypothetical protein J6Y04_05700 [Bacteroidaceae bacterium]|nr:hypothetical protein [Bacteroidaceae bacterium]